MAAPDFHDLYVANLGDGSVQVLRFGAGSPSSSTNVGNYAWVEAPNLYFPLRIPVGTYMSGSYPSALAATPDGKYVVVLDALSAALFVITASPSNHGLPELALDDETQTPVRLSLASLRSAPVALIAAPTTASDCSAVGNCRFYVSLSGAGAIAAVDLLESATSNKATVVILGLQNVFAVGGMPTRLAVSPTNSLLFATDAMLPGDNIAELVRVDTTTGAVSRSWNRATSCGVSAISGTSTRAPRPAASTRSMSRM